MIAEQERAVATAERVLGVPLQHATPLSSDDRRNLILRASAPSRSVIIKATRDEDYRPQDAGAFETGLVKEWVATAFLSQHAPGNAPAFLGGDAELGLIVREDLGVSLGSMVAPLLGDSARRCGARARRLCDGDRATACRHASLHRPPRRFPAARLSRGGQTAF